MTTSSPDADLLAVCARFDALGEQIEAHNGNDTSADDVFDKLIAAQGDVIEQLEGLRPQTAEGRLAKARVAYEVLSWAGRGLELPLQALREAAGLEATHGA